MSESDPQRPVERPPAAALVNTAGEPEPEACSRQFNRVEALAFMLALLGTLWGVAYPAVLVQSRPANLASRVVLGGLVVFAALLSPWWHRDALTSWGLGSPAGFWRVWRRESRLERGVLAGLVLTGITLLTVELYRNATGAGQFVLGIEPATTFHLQQHLGGKTVVLALCLLLSLVWATCVVRYDNFWPALAAAGKILAVLLPLTFLVAWATNGPEAFVVARPLALLRNGLGYIFWGAVQQLLFCSYFGTRLRKGFSPAVRPEQRRWKRLAVAALNGLFFGLIHINSWLLVGFTWVLGIFLSWFFMEDRYRNLQAFGLVHGVLGTCVVWLFSAQPDPVRIRLRVGPWSMPHAPDLLTLTVVGLAIAGLGLGLLAVAWNQLGPRRQIGPGGYSA